MHCQITPSGGLIGGLSSVPPSKTIFSLLILCVDKRLVSIDCGTVASVRRDSYFLSFFLARRLQRWRTFLVVGSSLYATEAHWVRREDDLMDFPNTCTQEGIGKFWKYLVLEVILWGLICSIWLWQLSTFDRIKPGRWGQWTLLVLNGKSITWIQKSRKTVQTIISFVVTKFVTSR